MPALNSRYEDSLIITIMKIWTVIDPYYGPGTALGGPQHSKDRHSQDYGRKQRLQDGKEHPNITISAGNWLS